MSQASPSFDPCVWGPHFWFFLHTLAMTYPQHPNAQSKKQVFELMHSLPHFLPVENMGHHFRDLLNQYPVTAYLDSREALITWMHFIHNKVNEKLEKPQISLDDFYIHYYEAYKPNNIKLQQLYRWREKALHVLVIVALIGLVVYLYSK